MYASSGGVIPSVTENEWAGNGVVRLRGWHISGRKGDMVRGSSLVFGSTWLDWAGIKTDSGQGGLILMMFAPSCGDF